LTQLGHLGTSGSWGEADFQQGCGVGVSPCFAVSPFSFSLAPLPKLALGAAAALAAISLSPGDAQAQTYQVIVDSVQYDVTTFTGSYYANQYLFNINNMPWWGSNSLADIFVTALGLQAGLPNPAGNSGPPTTGYFGPYFAVNNRVDVLYTNGSGVGVFGGTENPSQAQNTYAVLSPIPSPPSVPGPLPLLGAGAAFGFSRKLRKRIKLAPAALGSSLA